jgi:hypothetical protein
MNELEFAWPSVLQVLIGIVAIIALVIGSLAYQNTVNSNPFTQNITGSSPNETIFQGDISAGSLTFQTMGGTLTSDGQLVYFLRSGTTTPQTLSTSTDGAANLTGPVTSIGTQTSIGVGVVTNDNLENAAVANLSGSLNFTTVTGALNTTGNTTVNGMLNATGPSTFGSNLTVMGNTGISGNVNLSSALSVSGLTTVGTVIMNGTATVNSLLHVNGITSFASTVNIGGITTINADLECKSTATITGPLTINSQTTVTGNLTSQTLSVSGKATVNRLAVTSAYVGSATFPTPLTGSIVISFPGILATDVIFLQRNPASGTFNVGSLEVNQIDPVNGTFTVLSVSFSNMLVQDAGSFWYWVVSTV